MKAGLVSVLLVLVLFATSCHPLIVCDLSYIPTRERSRRQRSTSTQNYIDKPSCKSLLVQEGPKLRLKMVQDTDADGCALRYEECRVVEDLQRDLERLVRQCEQLQQSQQSQMAQVEKLEAVLQGQSQEVNKIREAQKNMFKRMEVLQTGQTMIGREQEMIGRKQEAIKKRIAHLRDAIGAPSEVG